MTDTTDQQAVTVAQQWPASAIGALTGYQRQIDSDGTFVGVSRQALDEVIAWAEANRLASVSSASAEGWVLERFTLSERELDDECGCPEETWDTPFGVLNMHLTAGKPSNACLDNGDEGEWSIDLTRATIDDARAAFFGWSMIAASLPCPEPVPATNQAGEMALREACDRLLRAMTTRALRGRDHVPSMRDEQDAASALRAALATQPATSQEGNRPEFPGSSIAATPTHPTLSEDAIRKALDNAQSKLGHVSIDAMDGDNLAITLCTYFDDGEGDENESVWTPAASDGCDNTLKAIHAVYVAALAQVKAS